MGVWEEAIMENFAPELENMESMAVKDHTTIFTQRQVC